MGTLLGYGDKASPRPADCRRSARDAGLDTTNLLSEYCQLQKAVRRSSHRAFNAWNEARNKRLREYASDPAKSQVFWNVVLHRIKEDTRRAIELAWPNDVGFTSDPAHVANIFADQYRELGRDTPPRTYFRFMRGKVRILGFSCGP